MGTPKKKRTAGKEKVPKPKSAARGGRTRRGKEKEEGGESKQRISIGRVSEIGVRGRAKLQSQGGLWRVRGMKKSRGGFPIERKKAVAKK